ncbi:hypothetical protein D3H65_30865 [Paraflavitalea soli]|uniref:Uncharacterized protein n=1 Tax=Paraflavitalea soli TaxID=2315862 RepID=A0A3B7MYF7_9BACT|nr:hypothetical protein [Paraflavitalea soli]AXY78130.1 hypothetical protein D3H65_30865 [Paraflavitalea soli]
MNSSTILLIKSSVFDRDRELIVDNAFLSFDNKDRIAVPPTTFLKEDITAFRYGVKWIKGYSFVIGRIYCVDIKSSSGEVIKIRLKSIYGVNRTRLHEKYAILINALYDTYFDGITGHYLQQFSESVDFQLLGIAFRQDGILLDKNRLIKWEDLGTRSYSTYYTVFSKSDPNIYKAFEYLNDWNTGIIYSVSREILKSKNLLPEVV